MKKKNLKAVADFLYEVGILSKTPRSFTYFLGSGEQSVAEHINRAMYVGYVLATLDGKADVGKVMQMCLFHDLAEARTSDLNYIHQKYVMSDEESAIADLVKTVSFGNDLLSILTEYKERKSKEALIAKDADVIEFILSLREQVDTGNTRAETWIPSAVKRLKTKVAQELIKMIVKTPSDDWWFSNKEDRWWVSRSKKVLKKRF